MVKSCSVFQCTNNKARKPELSFYMIPSRATEPERREAWLRAIGRGDRERGATGQLWEPKSDFHYVCSAHFISGTKNNSKDHPDYVPTIFPHHPPTSVSSSKRKIDRYDRAQRKKIRGEDKVPVERSVADEPNSSQTTSQNEEPHQEPAQGFQANLQSSEREQIFAEMDALRRERDEATARVKKLEASLLSANLSAESVKENGKCKMMTGITWHVFMQLFLYLKTFCCSRSINKDSLPLQEQLFITLVKLRHGVAFEFLASVRGIKKSTTIDYFWKWLDLLHAKIGFMVKFQDRAHIFRTIPPVFKNLFPRLTSIIDCFEIFTDAPRNLKARAQCWSSYKHHCTIKVFISCSPLGHINYISRVYGGRASDVQIVKESDFMSSKYHFPGDQILADRGFTLQDEFAASCGACLLTPAFTKGRSQLSAEEVEVSRKISSVRIHIERVIGLLKNRYKILQGTLPLQSVQQISNELAGNPNASIDKIIRVCAALVNLGESIVYQEL